MSTLSVGDAERARTACARPSRTRTTRARTSPRRGRATTSATNASAPASSAARRARARRTARRRCGAPAARRSDSPASSARASSSSVVHVDADAVEQRRRQVALAGVGQHADDVAARRRAPRHLERRRRAWRRWRCRRRCLPACASSRARRSASLPLTGTISSTSPSATRLLGEAGDEVGAPALHQMRPELRVAGRRAAVASRGWRDAAAEQRRVVGLGRDDADRRRRPP